MFNQITDIMKTETTESDLLHAIIVDRDFLIKELQNESDHLKELIKGFSTYSDDVYMVAKLENLHLRINDKLSKLLKVADKHDNLIAKYI